MGHTLYTKDHSLGLYDHEGYTAFRCGGCGTWESTWGSDYLGSLGHDPIRVRAACDCGWHGPELPWSAAEGMSTDDQEDALMALWELEHAGPLLRALEAKAVTS